MTAKRVLFTGRVQGVGFRATARSIARRHPVRGYVQNLPNGAVELVAAGRESAMTAFLAEVQAAFEGNIESVTIDAYDGPSGFDGFTIRH